MNKNKDNSGQDQEETIDQNRIDQARNKPKGKGNFKAVIGLLVMLLLIVSLAYKFLNRGKSEKQNTPAAQNAGQVDTQHDFTLAPPPSGAVTATVPNNGNDKPNKEGGFIGSKDNREKSGFSRSIGGVMVTSNHSENAQAQGQNAHSATPANLTSNGTESATGGNDMAKIGANTGGDIYGGATFQAGTVTKSKFDPNLLLEKGTYIPCVMRHAFNSNVDGQISCVVADDVFSSAGTVKLIEKGSRVNGVYRGGNVNAGSQQMFVIWQEIRTPNNLVVNVYSGSSDELGNAGLNGYVDYHWGIKLGMAALVSIVNVSGQNLSTQLGKSLGGNNSNTSSGEDSTSVATEILRQYANVKPTLYKNQGDKVGIFVSRDIDFSSVYNLKARSYGN
ncbi:TPA: TrbI/VirB10 family protein [Yersinia enterocolitica]|nr:TrbI/VirB10 family protein [Yersinia enterocolitica]